MHAIILNMNKKLIVGNWKMNPSTLEEAKRIYRSVNNISKKLSSAKVVICPPFVYIKSFISKNAQSSIKLPLLTSMLEICTSTSG